MDNMSGLTYLACPYTHDDPAIRLSRFQAANRAAAWLKRQGYLVYSPISHSHPIANAGNLPLTWDEWGATDLLMLGGAARLMILMIDGWQASHGIGKETVQAIKLGIPCVFLMPAGFSNYHIYEPGALADLINEVSLP